MILPGGHYGKDGWDSPLLWANACTGNWEERSQCPRKHLSVLQTAVPKFTFKRQLPIAHILFIYCLVSVYTSMRSRGPLGGLVGSLLLPCGFQGSNSSQSSGLVVVPFTC